MLNMYAVMLLMLQLWQHECACLFSVLAASSYSAIY